jgi:hypothetical protein
LSGNEGALPKAAAVGMLRNLLNAFEQALAIFEDDLSRLPAQRNHPKQKLSRRECRRFGLKF